MNKVFRVCSTVIVFAFTLFMPTLVDALQESEMLSRAVCPNFEVAIANPDGSLTNMACFGTYEESVSYMNSSADDDLVILERANNETRLIDAKYAIAYVSKGNNQSTINLYKTVFNGYAWTYVVGGPDYASSDAAFLGLDYGSKMAHILISGFDGYVNKYDSGVRSYEVIPLSWVSSTNYYEVTDSEIIHHLTYNISANNPDNFTSYALGPKPSMLEPGIYYSYDGNYFYTDLKTMLQDYRVGVRTNAVNVNNPYYNYYQYLPIHTRSTYGMTEIDQYINNRFDSFKFSYMYGLGYSFFYAQEEYGMNALLNTSLAIHESGNGMSTISRVKFNLFGHAAYDSSAVSSSTTYALPEEGVYNNAYRYYTYGYSFPSDSRYFGGQLGNKANGANVKYSSDPYWGEKIASTYYGIDKSLGLSDYGYYTIAIKNSEDKVYPNQVMGSSSPISITDRTDNTYSYVKSGTAVLVLDTVVGSDGVTYYKIQSDANLNENGTYIPYSTDRNTYDWDTNYVYVPAQYYTIVYQGEAIPSDVTPYVERDYDFVYFEESTSKLSPKAAYIKENSTLYSSPSLSEHTDTVLSKYQYVMVYAAAYDENNQLKAYLISSNYGKTQREWIEPSKLNFVGGMYGQIMIRASVTKNSMVNVRNSPGGYVISTMGEGNFFVIFDIQTINGTTWYHISYDGGSGYICEDNEQYVLTGAINTEDIILNQAPVINATDQTIHVGTPFEYMKGVTATDAEDGPLTDSVTYDETVRYNEPGTYSVTYRVTDLSGLETTKTIQVHVINDAPVITANDQQVVLNQEFDYMQGVTATDTEDGIITKKVTYTENVNINMPGPYEVTYTVEDNHGAKASITITVTVVQAEPIIYASNRVVPINSDFNYMDGVKAYDAVDGDITDDVTYTETVDTSIPQTYKVTYSVTNSKNLTTTLDVYITVDDYEEGNPLFAYHAIRQESEDTFYFAGFLGVSGMNNSTSDTVTHYMVFHNDGTGKEYYFKLDNWLEDYPYDVIDMSSSVDYVNNAGWFQGTIDLSSLPEGDYTVYAEVTTNDYKARSVFNNLTYQEQPTRVEVSSGRGYEFKMDYMLASMPLNMIVRDEGLISSNADIEPDNSFNFYSNLKLGEDGTMNITGYSYSIGHDYSADTNVSRQIVFENTETFKRYTFDVSSIVGEEIMLAVPDGFSKKRAWYEASFNIADFEKGTYAIYVRTDVDGFSDYGELKDYTFATFDDVQIGDKTYSLHAVADRRLRMELVVQ